ncbi:4-oxalomesaconate tautomerase [Microbacterium murale]|uniref:4-oxalomesaconate tautomerase n=1 Tax=Microbacterium murale TaxID=1081040 RepID=A0ABU0P7I0_9MICO|nr:4-oxalomesaconate tautomerase [Microbacterium murale]MDQ0643275.1 4-oxalomesaconate tautomerase [Microbacterium murale]
MSAGEEFDAGIRCMLMRGGTSKGAYFLADDLPDDPASRDELILRIMGSPDARQIDGIGGAHPLTSKVAVVSPSTSAEADVDYLFLQVGVDDARVATTQTCGNLLAGVGPFAVERGLVEAHEGETRVRIRLVNTGDDALASFTTRNGSPLYSGSTAIDGVPGTGDPIRIEMLPGARALFPTGNILDRIDGHEVTLIDNGMPIALMRAQPLGISGQESPLELESDPTLTAAVERIRRAAGQAMGLGDVSDQTVPKVILVSEPQHGGAISTRAFIPARVHTSLGVLMAASVAAAVQIPGTAADAVAQLPGSAQLGIEHPSGILPAEVRVGRDGDGTWWATSTTIRTARKLFDGTVFPRPHSSTPVRSRADKEVQ